ncbi:Uma2 family endonuclease [Streptomyces griseosporeus]|uniref:Uma2 family endonuclease n=1 Tax=Streptomyces griseosporeus TaxID=1910 RepID=UPI0036BE280E
MVEGDYLLTDDPWDELLWVWKQTDVPKGCKVEIIEGLVSVAPYSAVISQEISEPLSGHLYEVIPGCWGVYQRLALTVAARQELYVPDLAVVPRPALRHEDDFVPAGAAELVVEVTSAATACRDRTRKAEGYAAAGVPLYLLVDGLAPGGPTATLYGDPQAGAYRVLTSVPFGTPVALPAPFGLSVPLG